MKESVLKELADGSDVITTMEVHPISFIGHLFTMILSSLLYVVIMPYLIEYNVVYAIAFVLVGSWTFFIPLLYFIHDLVEIWSLKCILTTRSIKLRRGGFIFTISTEQLPLENVDSVSVKQGIFGKMFNYGTLKFNANTFNPQMARDCIRNPVKVKNAILEAVGQRKKTLVEYKAAVLEDTTKRLMAKLENSD